MTTKRFGALAALALLLVATPPFLAAALSGPNFDIDGNTASSGGEDDWESVIPGPGNLDVSGVQIPEGHAGPRADPDNEEWNVFARDGNFDKPSGWTITPGNVPAQDDLTNITVYALLPDQTPDGHAWMIMGMERVKKQGTFYLDFELNRKPWDGSAGTLQRTVGDVVVGFALPGNPTDPEADLEVLILRYDPPALAGGCAEYAGAYGGGWCTVFRGSAATLGSFGAATMNAVAFPVPPWGGYDDKGNVLTPGVDQVQPFFFAEAAIDLTELGLEPACPGFGSVHAKSRASLELNAVLKDLAGPVSLGVQCRLEGHKFLDVDGDGGRGADPPEIGLEGWPIELYRDGERYAATTTDADGFYRFEDLDDGTYTVQEVCPASDPPWVQSAPGATDAPGCGAEVHSGIDVNIHNRDVQNLDFGNGQPAINVTKDCTEYVEVGGTIEYTISVANPANPYSVDLNEVAVDDADIGFQETILTLPVGTSRTFKPVYSAPDAAGPFANTVYVEGQYTSAASAADAAACTAQVVDARIQIQPDGTNEVRTAHTLTGSVEINDGSGWVNAPGGTTIEFAIESGPGALSASSCTISDDSGACSVALTSDVAGMTVVSATTEVTVGGLLLQRTTDGLHGNSGPASKAWVDAAIIVWPSGTNGVREIHTLTGYVTVNDGSGPVNAPDGTTIEFAIDSGPGMLSPASCTTTDNSGTCLVELSSNVAGQTVVSATTDVNVGGLLLHRTSDGQYGSSGPALKTWVDARIHISPDGTNGIQERHTLTGWVEVNDGMGWANAQSGTTIAFAIDSGPGWLVPMLCTTADDSGECTVDLISGTAGQTVVKATTNVTVSGAVLSRATDGQSGNSGPARKTWAAARLRWYKVDQGNTLLPGAAFEVCRIADRFGDPVSEPCLTVHDNQAPDEASTGGIFYLTELPFGTYSVEETSAPPGFTRDTHMETVHRTDLSEPSVVIAQRWVNSTVGKITPTDTDCTDFVDGTADALTEVFYGVKDGLINGATPDVFFYYTQATAERARLTVDLVQANGYNLAYNFEVQNLEQIRLFNPDCSSPTVTWSRSFSDGQAQVTIADAAPGQDFIISVKYQTSSVAGRTAPAGPVHYHFGTWIGGVLVDFDSDGLILRPW